MYRNLTLNGGRAVRNEFILLHEFHRLKYVCPDKSFSSKKAKTNTAEDEDGEEAPPAKGRKAKYAGGLVFEPKRGLWDTYILVMDFNSLYPSIIQEYNIDFTTVERDAQEDEVGLISGNGRQLISRTVRRRYLMYRAARSLKVYFRALLLRS